MGETGRQLISEWRLLLHFAFHFAVFISLAATDPMIVDAGLT
jgi:hypothetical protein